MSETYTGDSTTGLIVAYTLLNDGDLRDAASVRVALQPLIDSIASLASGHPVFTGTPEFNGAAVSFTNSTIAGFTASFLTIGGASLLQVDYTSQLACHGAFELAPTVGHEAACKFNIRPGSTWQVLADATAYVREDGILRVDAGGNLGVYGFARVQSGGLLTVEDGGIARVESGGRLQVLGGGMATVNGALNVEQGLSGLGEINVSDSATINLTDTAQLTLSSTAQIVFNGASLFGSKIMRGPTRYFGPEAYQDLRLKRGVEGLTPFDQPLDAHHYDTVFFSPDEWAALGSTFTVTLNDVPGGFHHPVRICGTASGAGGVGDAVGNIVDSQGTLIATIQGDNWNSLTLDLVFDIGNSPRWRVELANKQ